MQATQRYAGYAIASMQAKQLERDIKLQSFDAVLLYGRMIATIEHGQALSQDMHELIQRANNLRVMILELVPDYGATLPDVPQR